MMKHRRFAAVNAQGIEAESPQTLRSKGEDLERKARFFRLIRRKNAPILAYRGVTANGAAHQSAAALIRAGAGL